LKGEIELHRAINKFLVQITEYPLSPPFFLSFYFSKCIIIYFIKTKTQVYVFAYQCWTTEVSHVSSPIHFSFSVSLLFISVLIRHNPLFELWDVQYVQLTLLKTTIMNANLLINRLKACDMSIYCNHHWHFCMLKEIEER